MAQIGNTPSDDEFYLDDEYQDLHLDDEDQEALVANNLRPTKARWWEA